jgi:16S rRNA processing protein RimM
MAKREAYLAVGRIIGAHGVHGEIKVRQLTDFPERFATGALLFLEGESFQREIVSVRPHKGMLLIRLSDLNDRNAVEYLRGKYLFVPREDAMPLAEDEYYEDELVGLVVETMEGELLGELVEIMWTGANEVYIVQGPGGEVLIPAIADVVQEVDIETGVMRVTMLPGLVD